MVRYHPDTRYLTDYAAGSLPAAQALCVASHLHYCSVCRARVAELTAVGDVMFQNQPSEPVEPAAFDALMARIDTLDDGGNEPQADVACAASPEIMSLPLPVRKLAGDSLNNLGWLQMGKHLRYSRLSSRRDPQETALFHIRAGGKVPRHDHKGEEITVILKGSFSDQDDRYHMGDFIVRKPGEKHQPVASQDEDCLCLYSLEAPLTMTNWFYRLLQPLVQRRMA